MFVGVVQPRSMIAGELKSQVDQIWNAFWTVGIANSIEVIGRIAHLLFIKCMDGLHTVGEAHPNQPG